MPLDIYSRVKKKQKMNAGGAIGGGLGSLAGQFILPGPLGAMAGGMIGEGLGGAIGSLFNPHKENTTVEAQHTRASASTFAYGGSMDKKKSYAGGGVMKNNMRRIGPSSYKFLGKKHEQGGIDVGNAEVEGGETLDFIDSINVEDSGKVLRNGGKVPYVFSERLKIPGKNISFAKTHNKLVKKGASPEQVKALAMAQEHISGRTGSRGNKKLQMGGPVGFGFDGLLDMIGGAAVQSQRYNKGLTPLLGSNPTLPNQTLRNATDPSNLSDTSILPKEQGLTMEKALPYLPIALDTVRGIFGKGRDFTPTQVSKNSLNTLRNTDVSYDIEPAIQENRAQTLAVQKSPGTSTNARLAAHAANLNANRRLLADKNNIEGERRLRRDSQLTSLESRIDSQNAGFAETARQQKLVEPSRADFLSQGLTDALAVRNAQTENANLQNMTEAGLLVQLAGADPATQQRIIKVLKAKGFDIPELDTVFGK